MKSFNCIIKVVTTSEVGHPPAWVEFEVTEYLVKRLEQVKFCCSEYELDSATIGVKPLHWDREQFFHIEDVALEVRDNQFRFVGSHGENNIFSIPVKITHIVDVFDNIDICLYTPTHEFCWMESTLFISDGMESLDTAHFIEKWIAQELNQEERDDMFNRNKRK